MRIKRLLSFQSLSFTLGSAVIKSFINTFVYHLHEGKVFDEPTCRCHQNPFIGALGIQEPVDHELGLIFHHLRSAFHIGFQCLIKKIKLVKIAMSSYVLSGCYLHDS